MCRYRLLEKSVQVFRLIPQALTCTTGYDIDEGASLSVVLVSLGDLPEATPCWLRDADACNPPKSRATTLVDEKPYRTPFPAISSDQNSKCFELARGIRHCNGAIESLVHQENGRHATFFNTCELQFFLTPPSSYHVL